MVIRLQTSFAALYALLERPQVARRVVVGLLVVHTLLLGYSAYVHSPTLNEPAHLVAGLSYWKFGRFDVYNVNPPLVRMVAALPVMAAGYKEDWSGFYEGAGARPEMKMGEDFVAANGERSFFLFMIARWACIPFSWLGAIVCFLWARDLYGRPSGVMAASIWCFEPNILAHASLITADGPATALGLAACYTFWRWLKHPSWTQAALTGVVLGLAELSKTTLILFYPLWPMMWVIYRWPARKCTAWLREAGMLAVRMVIGLYILNLGYGFEGSFMRLREFHFVSDLFSGTRFSVVNSAADNEEMGNFRPESVTHNPNSTNRFDNSLAGWIPVPFPKNYLVGIDLQQKDFEHYTRPSYFRGVWQDHGWWYYYLYACAIKVPLGLWALGVVALTIRVLRLRGPSGTAQSYQNASRPAEQNVAESALQPEVVANQIQSGRAVAFSSGYLSRTTRGCDEFILLFPAAVIFVTVSAKTGFSEHMRYVLPCFPFAFVWLAGVSRNLVDIQCFKSIHSKTACPFSSILLIWFFVSSLWIYPHSLSYFNESIGGPLNATKHLLGSNLDWGQDLRYLRFLLSASQSAQTFHVAYCGFVDPRYLGFSGCDCVEKRFDGEGGTQVQSGKCAVSVNLTYGVGFLARDGCDTKHWPLSSLLKAELLHRVPIGRAGYSILIFGLPEMTFPMCERDP